jgi:hypothetical protein
MGGSKLMLVSSRKQEKPTEGHAIILSTQSFLVGLRRPSKLHLGTKKHLFGPLHVADCWGSVLCAISVSSSEPFCARPAHQISYDKPHNDPSGLLPGPELQRLIFTKFGSLERPSRPPGEAQRVGGPLEVSKPLKTEGWTAKLGPGRI